MMNLFTHVVWVQKSKAYLDGIWTIASLVCVPSLVGITGYWALGDGGIAQVTSKSHTQVYAVAGETKSIKPDVKLSLESNRVVYKMRLVNVEGKTVYTYPEVLAEGDKPPEFGDMLIQVPSEVPTGVYQLVADVSYPRNPLKTNSLQVELAKINVDAEVK